ncbi:hypothetical protein QF026_004801 [Streptomyces aurantiacus]|uniref:hypothetical protein n=1 Tax=Streptomyces aurantiacus TaxID=47760 RepID=UPI00278DD0AE|nr:hypothetical protein [Streptomyces aurantiacus]MDQ0776335.1 hypothetical protein [Streptomyces aurantiacus]
MAIEDMVKQLDALLGEVKTLPAYEDWVHGGREDAEAEVLANRLEAAVIRLTMPESVYRRQVARGSNRSTVSRLDHNTSVVASLKADLKAGWTETVVELVHADTYSDYLEMADALLSKGYKNAAAVITGTSLEVHVRALCVKNGVTTAVAGKPKKADTMNADLKKAGVYDGLQQKDITTWMDLRNKAAHGEYDSYDQGQVRRFVDGVQAFMMKYPA